MNNLPRVTKDELAVICIMNAIKDRLQISGLTTVELAQALEQISRDAIESAVLDARASRGRS